MSASRGHADHQEEDGHGDRAADQVSGRARTSADHRVPVAVLSGTRGTGNARRRRAARLQRDEFRGTVRPATGHAADGHGRAGRRHRHIVQVHYEHAGAQVVRVRRGGRGLGVVERGPLQLSTRPTGMPSRQPDGRTAQTVRLSHHR